MVAGVESLLHLAGSFVVPHGLPSCAHRLSCFASCRFLVLQAGVEPSSTALKAVSQPLDYQRRPFFAGKFLLALTAALGMSLGKQHLMVIFDESNLLPGWIALACMNMN